MVKQKDYIELLSLNNIEGEYKEGFEYLGRKYSRYIVFSKGGRVFKKIIRNHKVYYRELTSVMHLSKEGVRYVGVISDNKYRSSYNIATIVLAAFKPIPERLKDKVLYAIFKDGNERNYDLDNLEWGTYYEFIQNRKQKESEML